jgi:hypothetical protein
MTFPILIKSYVTAICEAQEASVKSDLPVYLYRVNEGGYVIDTLAGAYSNEKLLFTFLNGEVK